MIDPPNVYSGGICRQISASACLKTPGRNNLASALANQSSNGSATIREAGPAAMIPTMTVARSWNGPGQGVLPTAAWAAPMSGEKSTR